MTRQFSISNIRVTKIISLPSLSSILFANIILKFTLKFVTKQSSNCRKEEEAGGKKRKIVSPGRERNERKSKFVGNNTLETQGCRAKVGANGAYLSRGACGEGE